jgi:exodeoxyribonuclease V beta subunit
MAITFAELDLAKNGRIEASAGTGKTYTLVRLALRYLTEGDRPVRPEELVLVTFTVKAAAELKQRLYQLVKERMAHDSSAVLRAIYDDFDKITVSTIHSFCQQLLMRYPFESGLPFEITLGSDTAWQRDELTHFFRSYESQLDTPLKKEAFRALLAVYGGTLPELIKGLIALINSIDKVNYKIEPSFEESEKVLEPCCGFRAKRGPFYNAVQQAIAVKTDDETYAVLLAAEAAPPGAPFKKVFVQLTDELAAATNGDDILMLLFKERRSNKISYRLFDILQAAVRQSTVFSGFQALITLTEPFTVLEPGQRAPLSAALRAYALNFLLNEIMPRLHKRREQGETTFSDLISDTARLLAEQPRFREAVRRCYKVALIDEFQDTDAAQWAVFKQIFDGEEHALMLIGDPKQSIYSFRGADPAVYLRACNEVGSDNICRLTVSYRSRPSVLAALNKIFPAIFCSEGGNGLAYTPVEAPSMPVKPPVLCYKGREVNGLEFIKPDTERIDGNATGDVIRREIVRKFCAQIEELLLSPHYAMYWCNEAGAPVRMRRVKASDIAVLTRDGAEARLYKNRLSRLGISAVQYKTESVLKSDEARLILLLLEVMAYEDNIILRNTLLVSPLCRLNAAALTGPDASLTGWLLRLEQWRLMAEAGEWAALLDDCFMSSGYFERLLTPAVSDRESDLAEAEERERRYVNIRHISEILIKKASGRVIGAQAMHRFFARLIAEESDSENEALRLEHDQDAVTLITAHSAKGLQYPIVFTHLGLYRCRDKEAASEPYYLIRHRTVDFLKSKRYGEERLVERIAEEERLFYVGLSRAESRLYLPAVKKEGWFLTETLMKLARPSFKDDDNELFADLVRASEPAVPFIDNNWPAGHTTVQEPVSCDQEALSVSIIQTRIGFSSRALGVGSYTSLWQYRQSGGVQSFPVHEPDVLYDDFKNRLGEDSSTLLLPETAANAHPLGEPLNVRGGADFGIALHSLFENLDFALARSPLEELLACVGLRQQVEYILRRSLGISVPPATLVETFLELFWHTLNQPIASLGGFQLKTLEKDARCHELDFLLYLKESHFIKTDFYEGAVRRGFFKGFIDLIFLHNGQYFLLDWKTTLLGTHYNNYAAGALDEAMQHHGYKLQYLIYWHALYRYARSLDAGFDYQKMGGVIYCFNRAMHARHTDNTGIFFVRPSEEEYRRFAENFQ